MRLACSTFSYDQAFRNGDFHLTDFLDCAWEAGLDGIELNDGYLLREGLPLAVIKRRATAMALDIAAVAVESNFYRDSDEEIERERDNILAWLEHAYFLGAPLLRLNTCQLEDVARGRHLSQARVLNWAVETFRSVVPAAEERGIILALENHFGITRTAADTAALVEAVDSPWFRVNLDTGNFCADWHTGGCPYEDTYEGIRLLAPLAAFCHAKIRELSADGKNDLTLDYPRIVGILYSTGYTGYLSVEYVGRRDPIQVMPTAVDMLRSCLP